MVSHPPNLYLILPPPHPHPHTVQERNASFNLFMQRTTANIAISVNVLGVQAAIPKPDGLTSNIHFSDDIVKMVTSASVFNPVLLVENEAQLTNNGTSQLTSLI